MTINPRRNQIMKKNDSDADCAEWKIQLVM